MNKIFSKSIQGPALIVLAFLMLSSCNKIYEPIPSVTTQVDTTNTIAKLIEANTNYSFFTVALKRTGLYSRINTPGNMFTVYAPSDAAFTTSGISLAAINGMPLTQLTPLISYHILQNEKLLNSQIPVATVNTPNLVRVSTLSIGTLPATATANFPLWMPVFPGKNSSASYLNNIPVVQADVINAANGVLHSVAAPVVPPSRVLFDTLSRDPDYAYFVAAIVRADSGVAATSTSNLQYALSFGIANLTVFAPTNAAFQAVLYAKAYPVVYAQMYKGVYDAQIAGGATPTAADAAATAYALANAPTTATALVSSPTVFSNAALYPVLTAQVVKGIVVYHILGKRYFSVNFPSSAASYTTLLNSAIPTHPGLSISSTLVSNFGAAVSVKGVGNATAASATATATGVDRHAINGNLFKINQVLLPQ